MNEINDAELNQVVGGTVIMEAAVIFLAGLGAYQGAKELGKDIGDWIASKVEPTNWEVINSDDYYSNMPVGVQ